MKRVNNLYHLICDLGNIKLAIMNASKGKRDRLDVQLVLAHLDDYALLLQDMLLNKTYTPSEPREKEIFCSTAHKYRTISIPQYYPDLCVQWALIQILAPTLTKGMYEYCCGSVPGRGGMLAKKAVEKWIRKDKRDTKYCLKMDIEKFYPSVNLGILKNAFRRKVKDYNTLWLIDSIIDVCDKGLPIGFYTSPWFANFLLQDMDHIIKEKLGVKYYVRYADDMVLFGRNKKRLHQIKNEIERYLKSLCLSLNHKWQVFRIDKRALDFVGYRFFRTHTLLRKSIARRFRRRVKRAAKRYRPTYRDAAAIFSYLGWTKHCNAYNFYQINIRPYFNDLSILKEIIRYESIKRSKASRLSC